jgi:hypothetical protein
MRPLSATGARTCASTVEDQGVHSATSKTNEIKQKSRNVEDKPCRNQYMSGVLGRRKPECIIFSWMPRGHTLKIQQQSDGHHLERLEICIMINGNIMLALWEGALEVRHFLGDLRDQFPHLGQ